ncbi:tryptophan 2,3-dioxygenase [Sphaerisporangium krabiense]|uniref:Tryptophan 2,3-dioxygenase n=1 Tax=Sphaerisporangium krabiense TaxID=763782 RepID=A0A7W9DU85_9ACTN|nr:tryptophan 2,3-dioxygenase family protein [Sphaerisporangium krabiense]MBB5631687.1 tryptophan 2,3-dioxygenase [Sphaerisporangium krabiense]GII60676.1 tryptophan 2,3-dioxygenase [Sphaerisporangium krabiense]
MTTRRRIGLAGARRRPSRAVADHGAPKLEFTSGTPYDDYVAAEALHGLQRPVTDLPEERAFLVTTQVMELYFGLIRAEWRLAQRLLDAGDVVAATAVLARSVRYFEALNASWAALSWLTPAQFNSFRDALGEASGFQSAMYRHLEFLLGNKSEPLTRPHRRNPRVYQELVAALRAPSLYDSVLALLARRGFEVPPAGDPAAEYVPSPLVEAAWVRVYAEGGPGEELWTLAETLTDLSERFSDWRYRHLMAVRRSMGAKPGSGGSSGLTWLERSLRRDVFPELWSARTAM